VGEYRAFSLVEVGQMCRTLCMNTCDRTPPGYRHLPIVSCEKTKKVVTALNFIGSFFCVCLFNVMLSSIRSSTPHSHHTRFCVLLTLVQLRMVLNLLFVCSECSFLQVYLSLLWCWLTCPRIYHFLFDIPIRPVVL
jgi:hypothetical protein